VSFVLELVKLKADSPEYVRQKLLEALAAQYQKAGVDPNSPETKTAENAIVDWIMQLDPNQVKKVKDIVKSFQDYQAQNDIR
jgi:hypothetical protein